VQLGKRRVRGKERGGGGYWDGVIVVFCVIRALRC